MSHQQENIISQCVHNLRKAVKPTVKNQNLLAEIDQFNHDFHASMHRIQVNYLKNKTHFKQKPNADKNLIRIGLKKEADKTRLIEEYTHTLGQLVDRVVSLNSPRANGLLPH